MDCVEFVFVSFLWFYEIIGEFLGGCGIGAVLSSDVERSSFGGVFGEAKLVCYCRCLV